jgi:hypothetical protein
MITLTVDNKKLLQICVWYDVWMSKVLPFVLIYFASWCYVLAQYYHLTLSNWTFITAMAIALPLVIVEYSFALHGNKLASASASPFQILLVTVCFYIINIIILNIFVLKTGFSPVRDVSAILLLIAAILISTNTRLPQ